MRHLNAACVEVVLSGIRQMWLHRLVDKRYFISIGQGATMTFAHVGHGIWLLFSSSMQTRQYVCPFAHTICVFRLSIQMLH